MDTRIKADSYQDTALRNFHVTFASDEVEGAYLKFSGSKGLRRGWLEITAVNSDGDFEGRIKP